MKAPVSWLRDVAALPADLTGRQLSDALVRAGLEVETVEEAGADVQGPVVVGRVLDFTPEEHSNGKTIRWCSVDVGEEQPRGIVCGAPNFAVGDLVVVALPGARLPGDFEIAARRTYGHVSDGMICSARELGLGDDHSGIMVLTAAAGEAEPVPGQDARPVLRLDDEVLDIAVTPDRGYCLSIRGLGREAAQATGTRFTDPVDRPVPAPVAEGYPVAIESDACSVFTALTVTGLDPSRPSPRWLTRRLQLAGMRPISLVVDVANHVMLETGQPLHTYDASALAGTVVARQARRGEKLRTLDDTARALDESDLVIADDSGPIGLAGVMGGAASEVTSATTSVVIEAAAFDALTLARTSRRHKLSSEASRRYERGVDPAAGYAAAHRAAALLVELAGGSLETGETVVGTVPVPPVTRLDASLPERILGTPVDRAQVEELLAAVGVEVRPGPEEPGAPDGVLSVRPPTWRPDLRDPYDYVEEVGRLVGFETITPVVPLAPPGRGLTRSQRDRRAVTARLAAVGAVEVLTFPFGSVAELDRLGVPADDRRRSLNTLLNPLSDTQPSLRTTLLPGLFSAVTRNTSRGLDDLALFETGAVFFAPDEPLVAPRPPVDRRPDEADLARMDDALGDQPRMLAVVLTGDWVRAGWQGPARPASWTQAVALAEEAAAAVGTALDRRPVEHAPWHPGRCAELRLAQTDVVVGHAGELHPQVCAAFGLPPRTSALELELDVLVAAAPDRGDIAPLSSYPVAKEDVALVVDESVAAEDVADALRRGAGPLLESVELFDVFRGAQTGEGKKSLAYALRFRAEGRTLTAAEVNEARDAAVAATAELGAVQRTE
ncbi:phenylalanine--tRNA ligase subunit beta [Microlunatus flavus]|uniref:Phenylalanine--tRNA ligase beta subunit n=1 Tax=Microlunatus flavus TaxID=1036181 RepID=A0A1H9DWS5_9ACTN|nr:phenylalanine--tRNA ligase subunit beta [Microlunatus flavus]SEQ17792.1 phenylalanyl-tRNA synthetase beta chain [Microlunatus flavus]